MQTVITNFNETALSLPTRLRPPTLKLDAFKGVDPWDEEQIVTETGDGTAESSRDALFALHLTRTEIINPQSVPSSAWAVSNDVRMGILYQLKIDRSEEELVLLKKEWDRNVLHTSKVIGVLLDTLAPAENNSCAIFRPSIIRMLWDELLRAKLIVGSRAKANIFLSAEKMKDHHDAINISQFSCGDLPELLEKGRSVCEQHQLVFSTRGSPSPRNAVSVKYSAPTGPNMPAHSNDGVIGSDTYINGLLTEGFAGLQMEALHSEGGDGGIFADFADIFAQNESEDTNAGADVTEEGDEGYDEGSDGESSQGDGSEGDDSEGDGESQYAHENEVDDDVDEVMGEQ